MSSVQPDSVWLGRARRDMRRIMIGFTAATVVLTLVLIIGQLFFGMEVPLRAVLSPQQHPLVLFALSAAGLSIFTAAIYFSDIRAAIETEPAGFVDIFSLVLSRVAMIAIAAVVCVMFYEVVSRYVFVKPTLWANELSLWIASFVFLFAGLYAMQQRSHIRIYIIYDIMPRWMRKLADCLSVLLIWIFTTAMIWGGFNEARDKFFRWETFGTAWDPPIPATVKVVMLLTVVAVTLQATSNLILDWHKAPESHTPLDDIDIVEIENIRRTIQG